MNRKHRPFRGQRRVWRMLLFAAPQNRAAFPCAAFLRGGSKWGILGVSLKAVSVSGFHKKRQGVFMPSKIAAPVVRVFFCIFTLLFGGIFLCAVLFNRSYGYRPLPTLGLAAVFVVFFVLLRRGLGALAPFWRRWGMAVCGVFMVVLGAVQIVIGLGMRYTPSYDLDAIYGGGIAWAGSGDIADYPYYLSYFHMFPNNTGGLFLFRCVFGLAGLFGAADHFAVAVVFNTLLMQAAVFCTWDVLRRAAGATAAVFGLCLFAVFVPFWFMGAVFYTDLLAVLFPVLVLDLYLIARRQPCPWRKAALYAAMGGCAAIGAIIKFTDVIMLIAVAAAALVELRRPPKQGLAKTLLPLAAAGLALALVLGLFQRLVPDRILNPAQVEEKGMPLSHWVAMGLLGEGGYDEAEYAAAMALPSRTARNTENMRLIVTRLAEPGLLGLSALFLRKAVRCFGDGTYGLSIFLDDGPHNWGLLQDLALYEGRYYALYSHLAQGIYLAIFALALLAAGRAALFPGRGRRALFCPAPFIALFGLLLFLLMWETNARYTLNYMPVLFVCAGFGLRGGGRRVGAAERLGNSNS